MISVYQGNHHLDDLELHRRHGKVVRVAPNLVSVSDTDEINQIYGINTKLFKAPFYDLSAVHDEEGLVPDPFVIRQDKALHARMKRNAANAYSMNGLVQFEPWIDNVLDRLLVILDDHALHGSVCDLGWLLKMFAMDAVTRLTFGNDFAYMEKGDHHRLFPLLDLFTAYMSIAGHVAWLHPYLLGNERFAAWASKGSTSSEAVFDMSEKEIQKTCENPPGDEETKTFVARLILNQMANPQSITNRDIATHAFGNLTAGSDTTGIAARSAFYYTITNPRVYQRLTAEIRQNLQVPVTFAKANELPYLRAVIQEAMRIHPSVGQMLMRTVPKGGATVGGYNLAEGSEVGMSPWVLHRDPAVFPDPDSFVPERWIIGEGATQTKEQLAAMNRSFFAFGHGTHTCSGKHISIMEVTKLIANLLLRYDIEYRKVGEGYRFVNWWFTSQEGLNVIIRRRV
ncbi:hypothetical protein E8E14_001564 [Neopestalotiopsis sp. 37M]|nr:hypothetical protein E8E14_001564 [Neopestalotiopsis sp. 37M]